MTGPNIKNKFKVHKHPSTPAISKKPKTYKVKSNKTHPKPKFQQERHTGPKLPVAVKGKKLPVVKSDKDVRAAGQRQGHDAKLFAAFGQADHVKGKGGPKTGRQRAAGGVSRRSRSSSGDRPRQPDPQLGAVTAALAQALGASVASRPGAGLQSPQSQGDPRGVGGPLEIRRSRTVR